MPQRLILVIVLIAIALQMSLGASGAPAAVKQAPLDFGVVYSIPGDTATGDEIVRDLQTIKDRGFDHVNLSSWIWTLPTVGSPLRRRVEIILNWCDSHQLGVWLLQNVQYGSAEGGDFERSVTDSVEYVRPFVVDWVATLKGRSCVRGVILGNEVSPITPPDLQQTPRYRQAFVAWLQAQYPAIADLNKNWNTHFETFDDVVAPAEGAPGWTDYHRFAQTQFGSFYRRIFDELIKPELGASLGYGSKTSADPFLHRRYPGATMLCYDDLVAYYPIWIEKALSDCDARPAFNSEIHLYNDHYHYYPSIELTRYRYYMDALSNATANSSFSWGAWKSPEIAAIDKATPATLAEIRRLRPFLSALAASQRRSRIAVVVSEPVFRPAARISRNGRCSPLSERSRTRAGWVH
jgi:hypothetical protein